MQNLSDIILITFVHGRYGKAMLPINFDQQQKLGCVQKKNQKPGYVLKNNLDCFWIEFHLQYASHVLITNTRENFFYSKKTIGL